MNPIREIRNQVRAIQREKVRVFQQMEEEINAAFSDGSDGQEKALFRFDAFSIWGQPGKAEEVLQYLHSQECYTDDWFRGVFLMTKEQALTLGRLIVEWNQVWVYEITHEMADYNAFQVHFGPATGSEHEIEVRSPNGHYGTSWQWN